MGCVTGKSSGGGVLGEEPKGKLRLGDKLFEKRDKCVDLFCEAVLERIESSLSQWGTRRRLKLAYDDGIFHLFIIEATPSTRLFLDRDIVRERLVLTDEVPNTTVPAASTNTTSTAAAAAAFTSTASAPAPRAVELLQYAQTEDNLTKPVSTVHGLGVYLQPIENTCAYGVWVSWHRQHPAAKPAENAPPRKLRLNEGILNSTISIGTLPREGH